MAKHSGKTIHRKHFKGQKGVRCYIKKANGQWRFVKCPRKG